MKIGDIIARKDMPQIRYRIVGEAKGFVKTFWDVELVGRLGKNRIGLMGAGMVAKDDERWEVVK